MKLNMKNIKYLSLLLGLTAFVSCNEPDDVLKGTSDEPEVVVELPALTAGSADFSNYVSLGASFTAGYTDGAVLLQVKKIHFQIFYQSILLMLVVVLLHNL